MLLMHDRNAALMGAGIVLAGLPVGWLLTRPPRHDAAVASAPNPLITDL